MSTKLDMVEIAREVLGVPKVPIMDEGDEIRNLRAERDALAERLRQTPELREIVGELRRIKATLDEPVGIGSETARRQIADLLRHLDRESQEPFGLADAKGPLGQD